MCAAFLQCVSSSELVSVELALFFAPHFALPSAGCGLCCFAFAWFGAVASEVTAVKF